MSEEEWTPCPGFPAYAVSSHGRVRRVVPDLRGRMRDAPLKLQTNSSGYLTCAPVAPGRKQRPILVSRLVCEAFNGPPPSARHQAAHNDGVRTNNNASNLRWATPLENERDKDRHGTRPVGGLHHARAKPHVMARGGRGGRAKLTEEAVVAIRADRRLPREIANDHGVSRALIQMVKKRKVWAHV